jgi:hypothetical protein
MRVILYTPAGDVEDARRLEETISDVAAEEVIESYRSLESLALRLRNMPQEPVFIVLLAGDRNEMHHMQALRDMLSSLPVFLVIPDQDQETIAKAHLLHPRFLTVKDSDFADLGAVLQKKLSMGKARNWIPG